jgi:uncharacterized protein YecT (DUF1311 family)
MMIFKKTIATGLATLALSLAFSFQTKAQSAYESALEKIDAQHQDCLDNGENMAACSGTYYHAIDSMLNVVTREVVKQASNTEKTEMRTEQHDWLQARNAKFKEIDEAAKKDGEGSADRATAVEDKATFLRERLDEMAGKLK